MKEAVSKVCDLEMYNTLHVCAIILYMVIGLLLFCFVRLIQRLGEKHVYTVFVYAERIMLCQLKSLHKQNRNRWKHYSLSDAYIIFLFPYFPNLEEAISEIPLCL